MGAHVVLVAYLDTSLSPKLRESVSEIVNFKHLVEVNSDIKGPISELDEAMMVREMSNGSSAGSDVILPGSASERVDWVVPFLGKILMQRAYSDDG